MLRNVPEGKQRGNPKNGKRGQTSETDLIFFLPLFVVYVRSSFREETQLSDRHALGNFCDGKIRVNKKLFILEVILRMFFFIFTFSSIAPLSTYFAGSPGLRVEYFAEKK